MGEYKLIKIKKTPIKNGMYFIEKETIGKITELRTTVYETMSVDKKININFLKK